MFPLNCQHSFEDGGLLIEKWFKLGQSHSFIHIYHSPRQGILFFVQFVVINYRLKQPHVMRKNGVFWTSEYLSFRSGNVKPAPRKKQIVLVSVVNIFFYQLSYEGSQRSWVQIYCGPQLPWQRDSDQSNLTWKILTSMSDSDNSWG